MYYLILLLYRLNVLCVELNHSKLIQKESNCQGLFWLLQFFCCYFVAYNEMNNNIARLLFVKAKRWNEKKLAWLLKTQPSLAVNCVVCSTLFSIQRLVCQHRCVGKKIIAVFVVAISFFLTVHSIVIVFVMNLLFAFANALATTPFQWLWEASFSYDLSHRPLWLLTLDHR